MGCLSPPPPPGQLAMGQNPVPPVNIPIPTKIGSLKCVVNSPIPIKNGIPKRSVQFPLLVSRLIPSDPRTYAGSPASKGLLQFDLWGREPSKRWDWQALKQRLGQAKLRFASFSLSGWICWFGMIVLFQCLDLLVWFGGLVCLFALVG